MKRKRLLGESSLPNSVMELEPSSKKKKPVDLNLKMHSEILYFLPLVLVNLILDYSCNVLLLPLSVEFDTCEKDRIRKNFSLGWIENRVRNYYVPKSLPLSSTFLQISEDVNSILISSGGRSEGYQARDRLLYSLIEHWMADANYDDLAILQKLTNLCLQACHIIWEEAECMKPFLNLIVWMYVDYFYNEYQTLNLWQRSSFNWFQIIVHDYLPTLWMLDLTTCQEFFAWKKLHPCIITEEDANQYCNDSLKAFLGKRICQKDLGVHFAKIARMSAIMATKDAVQLLLNE